MKIIITLLASLLLAAAVNTNVFICDSKTSKAYHSTKTCRGIKNCSHGIKEVTLKEATGTYSRVACKICYK